MDILNENSGIAVKLVKFFGEPMNIRTPFSTITLKQNKTFHVK